MPVVEFMGKSFNVDGEGFLTDVNEWCPEWVEYVKTSQGIKELTEDHWTAINMLRDYYKLNGKPPMVRIFAQVTGFKLKKIYELFPAGPGKGGCKVAGLPKPIGCV
ncbi:MAG: TusE/DsrC/DsvC family sulfur relay protein [Syntrophales bacterium]|jgi:tRNA 2-thiouridine synthesizing protein E|nr:TusE/DsrC/DsvC family sulfur relay protein [Syntrophales bacterium]